MQFYINNNAGFCYQSKEKVLSSNIFGRMQIWNKKDKNDEPYWLSFRKWCITKSQYTLSTCKEKIISLITRLRLFSLAVIFSLL